MSDTLKKFSEAAKLVSSDNQTMRERVYGAYREHLSNINTDELPNNIQIIYEAVVDRLTSARPLGDLGEDESGFLAKDIQYMADVIKSQK